jgi:hypothetical protein
VLDVLARYGVSATFFVSGQQVAGRERQLQRMLADGNEIANGAFGGTDLSSRSDAEVADELGRTTAEIRRAVPETPCLARPPFGTDAERVARIAREQGMTTALWSIDPGDFQAGSAEEIAAAVLADARPGGIVVLHDGGDGKRSLTAEALPTILDGLRARGYEIVTVSALLAPPRPEPQELECAEVTCKPRSRDRDPQRGAELVSYSSSGAEGIPATGSSSGGGAPGHGGSGTSPAPPQGGGGPGKDDGPSGTESPGAGDGGTSPAGGNTGSSSGGFEGGGGSSGGGSSGGGSSGGGSSGGSSGGGSSGGGSSGGGTDSGGTDGGGGSGSSGGSDGSSGGSDGSGVPGNGNGNGNGPPETPPGHGGEPPGQSKDKGGKDG